MENQENSTLDELDKRCSTKFSDIVGEIAKKGLTEEEIEQKIKETFSYDELVRSSLILMVHTVNEIRKDNLLSQLLKLFSK